MGRAMEILVSISALAGIATFLGFRAAARSAVRRLGRKPEENTGRPPAERRTSDDHSSTVGR